MAKRWQPRVEWNPEIRDRVLRDLEIQHELIAQVLWGRGVRSHDDMLDFISNEDLKLHSPFEMTDMVEAVRRVLTAKREGQRVMVFGDYDVDGTTSTAMLYSFLSSIGINAEYYIPDRYKEGYGVSKLGIDTANEHDVKLIISVDCGIRSVELVEYASSLGIDFIICDHHMPGKELPAAIAVLDPKRQDCAYPFDELSGCGVAFKLIQALVSEMKLDPAEYERYYDLVAVSIASDLVPLIGENRALLKLGLNKLFYDPIPGFKEIIKALPNKTNISVENIVFMIGPRINAAGRIASGMEAVKMMLADELDTVRDLTNQIEKYNKERKELDKQITAEALQKLDDGGEEIRYSSVVYDPNWHKGVIGIVASRLIESHYRPTIVFTNSEGKLTGSARSIKGVDLHEVLEACSEHLIQFGGHYYAAGMTMLEDKLPDFKEAFESEVRKRLSPDDLIETLHYDAELPIHSISEDLYNSLNRLAPHGPENPRPTFISHRVYFTDNTRAVGADGSHLKVEVACGETGELKTGIGFGLADKYAEVKDQAIDVLFYVGMNEYRGRRNVQLEVKDFRISES